MLSSSSLATLSKHIYVPRHKYWRMLVVLTQNMYEVEYVARPTVPYLVLACCNGIQLDVRKWINSQDDNGQKGCSWTIITDLFGFILLPANIMFWWSYNLINFIVTVSKSLYFGGISHVLSSVYNDVTSALVCCNLPVLTVKIASGFNMKFMKISALEQLSKQLLILQPECSCIYI